MAEDRIDDTMNDEASARDLDALMNVEPSPEFVARVRTHLEARPLGARVPLDRSMLLWGAAALTLVVLMVWWNDIPETPVSTPAGRIADIMLDRPAVRDVPSHSVAHPVRQGESEVLISPRDAAGLRLLLAAVREGRLDSDALPPVIEDSTPMAIEPIVIEPLVAAADLDAGGAQ